MAVFRSLKTKLLIAFLPLCLFPLLGISAYSYYLARNQITEDRTKLYLESLAREIADKISLTLMERRDDTVAVTLNSQIADFLSGGPLEPAQFVLDTFIVIHEVYDLVILFDGDGIVKAVNRIDRREIPLDEGQLQAIVGQSLKNYTSDSWLHKVRRGDFAFLDWHPSRELAHRVYPWYAQEDIAYQYNIGFASPVIGKKGGVAGGVLALMNWYYIQEILDRVEERQTLDPVNQDPEPEFFESGYAFLFGSDHNTIIGHKKRWNRYGLPANSNSQAADPAENNYGTSLIETHGLPELQSAAAYARDSDGSRSLEYQYPPGTDKISGLTKVDQTNLLTEKLGPSFGWVCGVGINNEDIFKPLQTLGKALVTAVLASGLLIVLLSYSLARQISVPLRELTVGAQRISGGDLSERVVVKGREEIGQLAQTFNEMAASLEERSRALLELNRSLEGKVKERTQELEQSHQTVQNAYQELKEAQVQLIQSEKMASLGQLVAGIAHEIKNPLNFIYGNTEFLRQYIADLQKLIGQLEGQIPRQGAERRQLEHFKEQINYDFLLQDLETLIRNFEEGAKRIHAIIGDLRTFSRLDTDQLRSVDIHEPIGLALNLLRNQYRDRIRIHKDFTDLPPLECDPGKISQVVMNLLVNACHAITGQGDIWVRTLRKNGLAVIEIEDNGSGIASKHMGKIFEPFFTTKPVGKGTGLGLSISYGIIQQHKGSIRAESSAGRGSKFIVELPLREGRPGTGDRKPAETEKAEKRQQP